MKKLYFLLITMVLGLALGYSQTVLYQEDFETDTNGTNYNTSISEFSDGTGDFFNRTDGSNIGSYYQVTGYNGSYYFGAMDIDGEGASLPVTLTTTAIDVTGLSDVDAVVLLAEDDDGTNQDWDAADYLHITYSIDGGADQNLLWIENDGSSTNGAPLVDTDFDGTGDGMEITSTFTEFVANIPLSGNSTIQFKFEFNLDAGDEDIAIDNIRIVDGYVATPTLFIPDAEPSGSTTTVSPEELNNTQLEFGVTNFTVGEPGTASEGDGYISWTVENLTDGGTHDSGIVYDLVADQPQLINTFEAGKQYRLTGVLKDNTGTDLTNPEATYILTADALGYNSVTDIAALRSHVTANGEGLYYEITGPVLVSHTDSYINRHWIQDTNISGVLIYDEDGEMSTYAIGDLVSGIKGYSDSSNGILRLIPSTDSGSVDSSGNPVIPQTLTIPTYTGAYEDYESELIEFQNVSFVEGDGTATFSTGTNYTITDGVNTVEKRTDFYGADYIGSVIPSTVLSSLIGIAGEFNSTPRIYVRDLTDMTLSSKVFNTNSFSLYPNPTSIGYVTINSNQAGTIFAEVFDILGKKVIHQRVVKNQINTSNLKAGVYILKLTQNSSSVTKKLIVR
jgi:hypothetical protein